MLLNIDSSKTFKTILFSRLKWDWKLASYNRTPPVAINIIPILEFSKTEKDVRHHKINVSSSLR